MKKSQLEHVLRAASRITEENEFIVIGSQSLHGKYPDIADDILASREVDLLAKKNAEKTEFLNAIGMDSPFHEEFGYYADPVDANTAVLPKKWRNRLVHLKLDDSQSKVKAYCLEPHDLVVAKLAAARDKDKIFIRALLQMELINPDTVRLRLAETNVSDARLAAMTGLLEILERQASSRKL
ncbi:MAG: hypothetical protein RL748_1147 [Pseudomonadota bacterium]|jgi:hypothetical protein